MGEVADEQAMIVCGLTLEPDARSSTGYLVGILAVDAEDHRPVTADLVDSQISRVRRALVPDISVRGIGAVEPVEV